MLSYYMYITMPISSADLYFRSYLFSLAKAQWLRKCPSEGQNNWFKSMNGIMV
jgi:hypothetical protein